MSETLCFYVCHIPPEKLSTQKTAVNSEMMANLNLLQAFMGDHGPLLKGRGCSKGLCLNLYQFVFLQLKSYLVILPSFVWLKGNKLILVFFEVLR